MSNEIIQRLLVREQVLAQEENRLQGEHAAVNREFSRVHDQIKKIDHEKKNLLLRARHVGNEEATPAQQLVRTKILLHRAQQKKQLGTKLTAEKSSLSTKLALAGAHLALVKKKKENIGEQKKVAVAELSAKKEEALVADLLTTKEAAKRHLARSSPSEELLPPAPNALFLTSDISKATFKEGEHEDLSEGDELSVPRDSFLGREITAPPEPLLQSQLLLMPQVNEDRSGGEASAKQSQPSPTPQPEEKKGEQLSFKLTHAGQEIALELHSDQQKNVSIDLQTEGKKTATSLALRRREITHLLAKRGVSVVSFGVGHKGS